MTSDTRRARERAEVQEKILAAARELFVAEGVEAVSMRKIASAIDYTAAGLYTHFKDKDDLVRSLCRHDFGAFGQTMGRLGKIDDPIERIRRMGLAYIRFAVEHPSHYRLMFMTPHPVGPSTDDACHTGDPDHDGYAALRHAVKQGVEQGRFEADDPELLSQTLWAGVHGVASLEIVKGDEPWMRWRSVEKRAHFMVEALLRGVLKLGDRR